VQLVGSNVTMLNGANMAKCWSRKVNSKPTSGAPAFGSGLVLVGDVLVAGTLAGGAADGVSVTGLRARDGSPAWHDVVGAGGSVGQQPAATVMLAAGAAQERLAFIATSRPGPVTALSISAAAASTQWQWTPPRDAGEVSAMLSVGTGQLAVALSSGAVFLLGFHEGVVAVRWREQVGGVGGSVTALSSAPAGWGAGANASSVLLVSTANAGVGNARGRVVALACATGGVIWTAAGPLSPAGGEPGLTAAGGCPPTKVTLFRGADPAVATGPSNALLNDSVAVFGCPGSIHAVSSVGELRWSLRLAAPITSLVVGNEGLVYGWSSGVLAIDSSCRRTSDLELCPLDNEAGCSCHRSCTQCVDNACAWVDDGLVSIRFWDAQKQKMGITTRRSMKFCWEGNMFTLAKNRTLRTDNRTVEVATDYAPQYGQCSVNATFAVTFAVTVVFLLCCVTAVSCRLHFSTFGKGTLQKHYESLVARDAAQHGSETDTDSVSSETRLDAVQLRAGWTSAPDYLASLLLDPSLPSGEGTTQQLTADEAMFLLQKRLVARQYKYILYLQMMTYVLCYVLFYLNPVWIKIFPDAFLGPTVLAPVSVVALRSEGDQWIRAAFYGECFSLFMRMYSSFGLVFIGINCTLMSSGGCPAAFTTVFSVPFFLLSWYDLGFHAAAIYINRDLQLLLHVAHRGSDGGGGG